MQKRKRILGAAIGTMLSLGLLINPNAELSPVYGADAPVAINEANFPDAVFREYVKENFDTDGNEELSVSEMENVTAVDVSYQNVTDLTGIEYFINLEKLKCYNNQLSSLDVSRNTKLVRLECAVNNLSSLDVSRNTALEGLSCGGNNLNSLDVSQNIVLKELECAVNNLNNLDVSQNTELEILQCNANKLSSLDVSRNTALEDLKCAGNNLNSLDVSQNTELEILQCNANKLNSLDVSQNTKLRYLQCNNNKLNSLDVSQNTSLETLNCMDNEISLPLYQSGSEYYIDLSSLPLDTGRVISSSVGSYNAENGHIEGLSLDRNGKSLTYQYNVGLEDQIMRVTVNISGEPIIVTESTTSAPGTESTVTEQDMTQNINTTATGWDIPQTTEATNTAQNTPKTGDTMLPVWIAILGLFSTVSYLITKKKSGIK